MGVLIVRGKELNQCTLDISHPNFTKMFNVLAKGHPDAMDALKRVKARIEENPEACHRCIQPMPNYPECHGRVWKYDWAPASISGSTRKMWRLVVYAKEIKSIPFKLVAMACYSKSDESQKSFKELAAYVKAVQIDLPPSEIPTGSSVSQDIF